MKNILFIILFILFSMAFTRMPYQVRLEGKYLGQPLPGDIPVLFAKGIVSTDSIEHSAPAFSPDGKRVLWTVINRPQPAFMLESRLENGVWTVPAKTSFSSADADDFYPSFSIDGKTLFFSSRRKSPPGYPVNRDMGIWKVERKGNRLGNTQCLLIQLYQRVLNMHIRSRVMERSIFLSEKMAGALLI
jgi:hypothetical protein